MAEPIEISMASTQLQQPTALTMPSPPKFTFGSTGPLPAMVPPMGPHAVATTATAPLGPTASTTVALESPTSEPIYGTMIPNRIFVGGLSRDTTEEDLMMVFRGYGTVRSTKIIIDQDGYNKGYGFVTFETEEEAQRLQSVGKCIILRNRRLNIAPAVKKQQFRPKIQPIIGSNGALYYSPQALAGTINSMPIESYAAATGTGAYASSTPLSDFTAGPMPAIYPQSQTGVQYQPMYQYYSVPMNMPTIWPPSYYQDPNAINAQTPLPYPTWEYDAASLNNWRPT